MAFGPPTTQTRYDDYTGGTPTGNPWQVSGYQFDMDSANRFTGQ